MGDNASELGKTLAQLQAMGRFEKVDAARLQMLRSMARALDYDPSNAALWRQYREALKELTSADDSSESVDDALSYLFGSPRDASSS